MSASSITVSAPGSLMLLGEHAVLHGRRALAAAVNRRLRVELTPRNNELVEIESALGRHQTPLRALAPHPEFRFILEAIRRAAKTLSSGFTLRVESEFSHTIGFGSSAAVTAATVAALRQLADKPINLDDIREEAIAVVRAVQGRGSGADVAASVHGGMVCYRAEPREVRVLAAQPELCAVYSGYKTPTTEVIRRVEAQWADRRTALEQLYDRMDECVGAGIIAVEATDWPALGTAFNTGQTLMEELGVNTPELAAIIAALRADAGICGAKISGSGLGDCAIGIGTPRGPLHGCKPIRIKVTFPGLILEKP